MEKLPHRDSYPKITFATIKEILDVASHKKPIKNSDGSLTYTLDMNPEEIGWFEEIERSSTVEVSTKKINNNTYEFTVINLIDE
ncbi:MAG: hypothetical protein RLZZ480_911, partial [Candidatus Parcubacteria bacterium]|jgi:hypothetical protein